MELLIKTLTVNYFRKKLYLACLKKLWIHPWDQSVSEQGVDEIQSSIWVGAYCLKSYWVNPPTAFSDIIHIRCSMGYDSISEDYSNYNCRVSTKIKGLRESFSLVLLLVWIFWCGTFCLFACFLLPLESNWYNRTRLCTEEKGLVGNYERFVETQCVTTVSIGSTCHELFFQ